MSSKRGFKSNFPKPTEEESHTVKQMHSFKNEKQVIKMLVAVVVVFVICWAPILILEVLTAWGVLPKVRSDSTLRHLATAFHLMAYFNSCINPMVYGFMSKNFRESFRKALWCSICGKPPRRQLSLSHTRTTSLRHHDYRNTIHMTSFNIP